MLKLTSSVQNKHLNSRLRVSTDLLLTIALVVAMALLLISGTVISLLPAIGTGRYLDEMIFFGFLVVVFITILFTGRLYLSNLLPFLLVFSLIGLMASQVNKVPLTIAILGLLLATKPLVLLIGYQMTPISNRGVETLIIAIRRLLIAVTLGAVLYMFVFEILLGSNPLPGVSQQARIFGLTPARSFFRHPSPFSSIMTLTALYFFARFLIMGYRKNLILMGLSIAAVILSGRMKAIFLLPLGLISLFLLIRLKNLKIRRNDLFRLAILITICFIAALVFGYLLQEILITRFLEGASNVRMVLHRQAIEIIRNTNGLGAGFGMYGSSVSVTAHYSDLYDEYGISQFYGATPDNPVFITDQWWAWYLGETGIFGILIFLLALSVALIGLWKMSVYWYSKKPEMSVLGFTAVTFLVFGILSGYASVYITSPPTGYFIMALAGLAFALDRALRRQNVDLINPA